MAVYLLCFTNAEGKHRHYVGHTDKEPEVRLRQHAKGQGGKYTARVVKQGYTPVIAFVWPLGDRRFEYRIKQLSRANEKYQMKNWCPLCADKSKMPSEFEVENWKRFSAG